MFACDDVSSTTPNSSQSLHETTWECEVLLVNGLESAYPGGVDPASDSEEEEDVEAMEVEGEEEGEEFDKEGEEEEGDTEMEE